MARYPSVPRASQEFKREIKREPRVSSGIQISLHGCRQSSEQGLRGVNYRFVVFRPSWLRSPSGGQECMPEERCGNGLSGLSAPFRCQAPNGVHSRMASVKVSTGTQAGCILWMTAGERGACRPNSKPCEKKRRHAQKTATDTAREARSQCCFFFAPMLFSHVLGAQFELSLVCVCSRAFLWGVQLEE